MLTEMKSSGSLGQFYIIASVWRRPCRNTIRTQCPWDPCVCQCNIRRQSFGVDPEHPWGHLGGFGGLPNHEDEYASSSWQYQPSGVVADSQNG
jgi:hypothetical protein